MQARLVEGRQQAAGSANTRPPDGSVSPFLFLLPLRAQLYSVALREAPGSHSVLSNRAACYAQLGRWEASLADAARVVQMKPDYVKGHYRTAVAQQALGKATEAIAALEAGLQLEPGNEEMKEMLRELKSGRSAGAGATKAAVPDISPMPTPAKGAPSDGAADAPATPVTPATAARKGGPATILTGTMKKRGNAAFRSGDYPLAVDLYAEALKEEGGSPNEKTLCNRSAALYNCERYEESLNDACAAARVNPKHLKAHYRQGLALRSLNRHEEALSAFEACLAIEPDDEDVKCALQEAREAVEVVKRAGKTPGGDAKTPAAHEYKTAPSTPATAATTPAAAAPKPAPASTASKDTEAYQTPAAAVIATPPVASMPAATAPSARKLANEAFRSGNNPAAVGHYTTAIEEAQRSGESKGLHSLYGNRSAAFLNLGDHLSARRDAEKAIETKPEYFKGHYRLACSLEAAGQLEDALAALDAALKLDVDNVELQEKRAELATKLGKAPSPAESVSKWRAPTPEAAAASTPAPAPAPSAALNTEVREAARKKGNQAFRAGDYAEAVAHYSTALEGEGTGNHTTFSNRAASYMQLGEHAKALDDARRCITLKPAWVKGYYRTGVALRALGRPQEALEAFQKALEVDPGNSDVRQLIDETEALVKEAAPALAKSESRVSSSSEEGFVVVTNPPTTSSAGRPPLVDRADKAGGDVAVAGSLAEWSAAMDALGSYRLSMEARVKALEQRLERREAQLALYGAGKFGELDEQLRGEALPVPRR